MRAPFCLRPFELFPGRVSTLLSLLEDLPETYVLCVAGDGPLLPEWRHLAHDKGLDARVRFLGRVDREVMAGWYRAADLFVSLRI